MSGRRFVLLGLCLMALAHPMPALAAEGSSDVTMAPIWAASAVQLFFTVLSGVGLAAYHRNQTANDQRAHALEASIERLELRLNDVREDGVRRQELVHLESKFDTKIQRMEAKLDDIRSELRLIHDSLNKLAGHR